MATLKLYATRAKQEPAIRTWEDNECGWIKAPWLDFTPFMAQAEQHLLIGHKIAGKFAVEAFIGSGAMGAVYRARQESLDKVVALKLLHRDLAKDATFFARFMREAKAASRIDHPNSMG